jgi:hypothetical protein
MEPNHHADPLEEALSHGSQRVAQLASLVAAMTQVAMHRKTLHESRSATQDGQAARALLHQEKLLHDQVNMAWAPAHDKRWLADADLIQTGRAWAAAASDSATDPTAASAMRKCEDRLRTQHPHAMTRYDRLRTDGLEPLEAMRQAAPLFARPPDVRVGDPAPSQPALTTANAEASPQQADHTGSQAPTDADTDALSLVQERGLRIAEALQTRAHAAGQPPLGGDELALILEAVTNLPEQVISHIATETALAQGGEAPGTRTPAHLAAQSFPFSAADALRAGASSSRDNAPRHNPAKLSTAHMRQPNQPT